MMEDATELRDQARRWRALATRREGDAAAVMVQAARELEAEADRLDHEERGMSPTSLRDRARRWREIAESAKPGAADAMIEAACELEARATQLDQDERSRRKPGRAG